MIQVLLIKTFELVSDKLIGKIDWNIDNHKLSFKHSYVKAEQFPRSFFSNCSFDNGSQLFESVTNSTSLELNSRFGNKFSNNLVVAYTNVADDRNASGILFQRYKFRWTGGQSIFFWCRGFYSKSVRSKVF
jgi:hypothetical protein